MVIKTKRIRSTEDKPLIKKKGKRQLKRPGSVVSNLLGKRVTESQCNFHFAVSGLVENSFRKSGVLQVMASVTLVGQHFSGS